MDRDLVPLVLIKTVAAREIIVVADDLALAKGIRPGMTLAEGRALYARVESVPFDPGRNYRSQLALSRWLLRFSPTVQCGTGLSWTPLDDPLPPHSESIFLDVTGSDRLFHGLDNLLDQVRKALSRLNIRAGLAIAPTPGAAWALAAYGPKDGLIISSEQITAALRPLPPEALRLDDSNLNALHHLGIESIAQLMTLPRATLPARFGPNLLNRLDQALDHIHEPLIALRHESQVVARMEFDGVVDSLEAIWMVFRQLLAQLIADLARRGCGARQVRATFQRAYASPIEKTILLSRPSRDPANLFNLLRCALETLDLEGLSESKKTRRQSHSFPSVSLSLDSPGFLGIELAVPVYERITDEQIHLQGQEELIANIELAHLIERLRIRLDPSAVTRTELVESHLPERNWRDGKSDEGERKKKQRVVRSNKMQVNTSVVQPSLRLAVDSLPFVASSLRRSVAPLFLLPIPLEIPTIVSPSEDRDGRPISFTLGRDVHRLPHAVGPHRVGGLWWEGHHRTRDYFDVESQTGQRFWIFRVIQTGKWFLHGEYG